MTRVTLALLLYSLLSASGEPNSELFCNCHVAHHKQANIAIHCTKQSDAAGVSCGKVAETELPAGYRFIPRYGLFKLYRTFMPWQDARQRCAQEGATLVVPTDANMLKGLQTMFSSEPGIWYAYIGVSDLQSAGFYLPADGDAVPYLNWAPGEPNHNTPDEHCLTIDSKGQMNDYPCTRPSPFFCQRPLPTTIPQDYRWIEEMGRFVARRDKKVTYDEARRSCQADGGRLAVPDTWVRGQALLRLLEPGFDNYLLGFTDSQAEGDFVTETGRHLRDMEFRPWGKGEPNNSGGGQPENCLAMRGFGYYNDVRCDEEHPFICEIVPV